MLAGSGGRPRPGRWQSRPAGALGRPSLSEPLLGSAGLGADLADGAAAGRQLAPSRPGRVGPPPQLTVPWPRHSGPCTAAAVATGPPVTVTVSGRRWAGHSESRAPAGERLLAFTHWQAQPASTRPPPLARASGGHDSDTFKFTV